MLFKNMLESDHFFRTDWTEFLSDSNSIEHAWIPQKMNVVF